MFASEWKTVLLDYDRGTTEFTGDDDAKYSALCDLGDNYEFVTIFIPTLTSSPTGICVQRDGLIATVPVQVYARDDDATGCFAHATSNATTTMVVTFRLGGCRYFRIYNSNAQGADRTYYCRGFNRMVHGT